MSLFLFYRNKSTFSDNRPVTFLVNNICRRWKWVVEWTIWSMIMVFVFTKDVNTQSASSTRFTWLIYVFVTDYKTMKHFIIFNKIALLFLYWNVNESTFTDNTPVMFWTNNIYRDWKYLVKWTTWFTIMLIVFTRTITTRLSSDTLFTRLISIFYPMKIKLFELNNIYRYWKSVVKWTIWSMIMFIVFIRSVTISSAFSTRFT